MTHLPKEMRHLQRKCRIYRRKCRIYNGNAAFTNGNAAFTTKNVRWINGMNHNKRDKLRSHPENAPPQNENSRLRFVGHSYQMAQRMAATGNICG